MANPLSKFLRFGQSALWQKKDDRVVGLDFGHSSVKAVQLRREKGRAILETYGEIALGPYAGAEVGQAVNPPAEKIGEALTDLMRESNTTATSCAMSVPLSASLISVITLCFA